MSVWMRNIPHHHHNHFMALFLGPPRWAGARRELLDPMVQRKINRGRHTDHLAGRHSIGTNQCPPPPSSHIFYRPDALSAAQPTASKHWRQLVHSDWGKMLEFSSTVLPAPSPCQCQTQYAVNWKIVISLILLCFDWHHCLPSVILSGSMMQSLLVIINH